MRTGEVDLEAAPPVLTLEPRRTVWEAALEVAAASSEAAAATTEEVDSDTLEAPVSEAAKRVTGAAV